MASSNDLNIGTSSKNESNLQRESQYSSQGNRQNNMQGAMQGNMQNTMPEVLTNPIYTPAFLRGQIGKLMQIEFLIGTNNMVDRIGFLEDVGASYVLLRSFEGDSLIYADIYAIKFITISATYGGMAPYQTNSMGMQNMNNMQNINSNMYRNY